MINSVVNLFVNKLVAVCIYNIAIWKKQGVGVLISQKVTTLEQTIIKHSFQTILSSHCCLTRWHKYSWEMNLSV